MQRRQAFSSTEKNLAWVQGPVYCREECSKKLPDPPARPIELVNPARPGDAARSFLFEVIWLQIQCWRRRREREWGGCQQMASIETPVCMHKATSEVQHCLVHSPHSPSSLCTAHSIAYQPCIEQNLAVTCQLCSAVSAARRQEFFLFEAIYLEIWIRTRQKRREGLQRDTTSGHSSANRTLIWGNLLAHMVVRDDLLHGRVPPIPALPSFTGGAPPRASQTCIDWHVVWPQPTLPQRAKKVRLGGKSSMGPVAIEKTERRDSKNTWTHVEICILKDNQSSVDLQVIGQNLCVV